ncbi:MAG: diguanylate cyclase, partial [Gammaproteobacteria bacterium]
MWQRLSIRTQLIALMAVLLIFVEISTLVLVSWFDQQERRTIAIEQAQTLGRSLNNDLLKALLSPDADIYSDISFRISGFKSVDALVLFDENNKAVLSYGELDYTSELQGKKLLLGQSWFSDKDRLFLQIPVQADNYAFGQALIIINPEQFQTKLYEHYYTLIMIFPFLFITGLAVSWKISSLFTQPFLNLASAIKTNDVQKNEYQKVSTVEQNEVKLLFDGYNEMITRIEKETKLLHYYSRHDSLTGLYNRHAIEQEILTALKEKNSPDTVHALLSIDLDQFKLINDSAGHTAGDKLLQMIAQFLSCDICTNMKLARVGGDDFFLLLKNISRDEATDFAEKQIKRLQDFRFCWKDNTISVSASIGMVFFKAHEYTVEELINTVDIAFYTAKAAGFNQLHILNSHDKEYKQTSDDITIAGYIKEALQDGPSHFELFAQAIIPLQYEDNKISYEVLIRMWDSHNNFMPPDSFLFTAERYHMMVDIDIYVLETYLKAVCQNPEHIEQLHSVHLNLAGGTLNNADFQSKVKEAIATYDFPWERLELEITETSAIGNLTQASEFINFCRSKGIGFALDDFGTGMSSFEYLKNLPFNVVKIDGSFVRDMLTDPIDKAMIQYTHEICQLRNQETIA